MLRTRTRILAATGLSAALLLGAAACGDDDDATTDTTTPSAEPVTVDACDAYVGLSGAMAGDPSQAGAAVEAFVDTAPTELADHAATMVTAYEALAEGGDPSVFSDDAFVAASAAVADAYFAGCETSAELDVDGVDYGFEGLPEEVAAGRVALRFTNATEHDEPHELVLFQRLPGTDETVEELLALPEDEVFTKVAMAGVVFADAPGAEATAMLDLEAGEYIALCFIPIGGGEEGPPHFTGGMVAELTVA
ncbi:MAG: hypothetical protein ACSLFP_04695 [Acidimicrobiales bacterium]